MEIKYCGPTVFTNDETKILEQFKSIGFELKHHKDKMEQTTALSNVFVLEDSKGNNVSVIKSQRFPQTFSKIRMKVDNFEEALEHFTDTIR